MIPKKSVPADFESLKTNIVIFRPCFINNCLVNRKKIVTERQEHD